MQIKEKRLLVLAAVLLIVFALAFMYMKKNTSEVSNTIDESSNIKIVDKEYDFDKVKITDISMLVDGVNNKFSAKITNKTSEKVSISKVNALLIDNRDFVIATYTCLSDVTLAPNDTKLITMSNISELYDITSIEFTVE